MGFSLEKSSQNASPSPQEFELNQTEVGEHAWSDIKQIAESIDQGLAKNIFQDDSISKQELEKLVGNPDKIDAKQFDKLHKVFSGLRGIKDKAQRDLMRTLAERVFLDRLSKLDVHQAKDRNFAKYLIDCDPKNLKYLPLSFILDKEIVAFAVSKEVGVLRYTVFGKFLYEEEGLPNAKLNKLDPSLIKAQLPILMDALSNDNDVELIVYGVSPKIAEAFPKEFGKLVKKFPEICVHAPELVVRVLSLDFIKDLIAHTKPDQAVRIYMSLDPSLVNIDLLECVLRQVEKKPSLILSVLCVTPKHLTERIEQKWFEKIVAKLTPDEATRLYPDSPEYYRNQVAINKLIQSLKEAREPGKRVVQYYEAIPEHVRQKITSSELESFFELAGVEYRVQILNASPIKFVTKCFKDADKCLDWVRISECRDRKAFILFYTRIPDSIKQSKDFFFEFIRSSGQVGSEEEVSPEIYENSPQSIKDDPDVMWYMMQEDKDFFEQMVFDGREGEPLYNAEKLRLLAKKKHISVKQILLAAAQADANIPVEILKLLGLNSDYEFWKQLLAAQPRAIWSIPKKLADLDLLLLSFQKGVACRILEHLYKNVIPDNLKDSDHLAELAIHAPYLIEQAPENQREEIYQKAVGILRNKHKLTLPTAHYKDFLKFFDGEQADQSGLSAKQLSFISIARVLENRRIPIEKDNRRSALVFRPVSDPSGAFDAERTITPFTSSRGSRFFRLDVKRIKKDSEFIKDIREAKHPISYLVLSGHGQRPSIQLGYDPGNNSKIDTHDDELFQAIAESIAPGGTIMLDSCSTGEGRQYKQDNLANALARYLIKKNIKNVTIISLDNIGYGSSATINSTGKVSIDVVNTTRIYKIKT